MLVFRAAQVIDCRKSSGELGAAIQSGKRKEASVSCAEGGRGCVQLRSHGCPEGGCESVCPKIGGVRLQVDIFSHRG